MGVYINYGGVGVNGQQAFVISLIFFLPSDATCLFFQTLGATKGLEVSPEPLQVGSG